MTQRLRCAILDDYQHAALRHADWSPLRERVDVVPLHAHIADRDALAAALHACEIVVAMRERTPFDAALFARLPRLRLLITSGMRNASIDLAAAAAHGVLVCGTASASEPPVELTWALILALARHVVAEHASIRDGGWQHTVGMDLHGRRLGLLGLGKTGTQVARIAHAFGMRVGAWSPHLTPERAAAAGVDFIADKRTLLATSDIVSVHLVLGERTRGLLGADDLRAMQRHALLINTSRAAIVDRDALLTALHERWIAGAGVDVFEHEPLPADDPLRHAPNLLATPHLGYVTERNYRTYYGQAVENIVAWLAGAPVRVLG